MRKYSKILIFIFLHVEKIHRYVFDIIYVQNYKLKFKDKVILKYYNFLFKLFPDFRIIKHWQKLLIRAYKLNKLSIINIRIYKKIRFKNFVRYSKY